MTYRTLDAATWGDPWFEELDPLSKLLFLYLVTSGRQTNCGCFTVSVKTISYETGMSASAVRSCLKVLTASERVVWWDDLQTAFVRNFYRHQRAKSSGKFTISARNALGAFPQKVRAAVYAVYPDLRLPIDSLSVPYPYPTDSGTTNITESQTQTQQNTTKTETNTYTDTEHSIHARAREGPTGLESSGHDQPPPGEGPGSPAPPGRPLVSETGEELDLDWERIVPHHREPHSPAEAYLGKPKAPRYRAGEARGRAPRGVPLPADWEPSEELIARCGEEGLTPSVDLQEQARRFREWFTDGDGQGVPSLNWDLRYLQWVRREADRPPGGARPRVRSVAPGETPRVPPRQEIRDRPPHTCEYPGCEGATAHRYCMIHGVFPRFEALKSEFEREEREEEQA